MRVAIYRQADEIPAGVWDAVAPPDFFFQRSFLHVMQESAVERARYRYLIVYEHERPVGLAILSSFTLRLDLLADDPWIGRLRRRLPRLLDVPIICCGIPASYGQHSVHLVQHGRVDELVRCIHGTMNDWASEENVGLLLWKEWNPHDTVYAAVLAEGYVPLPTLPDHRIHLTGETVDAFISGMRSHYRRKFRAAAALMRDPGPIWRYGPFQVQVKSFEPEDAAAFHVGYEKVMGRARVKLETYPPEFFVALATSSMDVRLLQLTHVENSEPLEALLYANGDVLTFALVSKVHRRYRNALYTMLLQCVVLYGIHHHFREVRLGQTSSFAKGSVGAVPRRLETLVLARAAWKQHLLRQFGTRLFPEVETPCLAVFRQRLPAAAAECGPHV